MNLNFKYSPFTNFFRLQHLQQNASIEEILFRRAPSRRSHYIS